MANKIDNEKIIEINRIYLIEKTYAATARKTGVSAGTVKKYIIPNFIDPAAIKIKKFNKELPEFNPKNFPNRPWDSILLLDDDEKKEIEELWEELVI